MKKSGSGLKYDLMMILDSGLPYLFRPRSCIPRRKTISIYLRLICAI